MFSFSRNEFLGLVFPHTHNKVTQTDVAPQVTSESQAREASVGQFQKYRKYVVQMAPSASNAKTLISS
jgi:hypothetical protein